MNSAYAHLEDYLKKLPPKEPARQMRNIDFIYLINLDERPEKWKNCMEQLSLYGISPYRFSAVNGWDLPLAALNSLGVKYEPWMNGGEPGTCYLEENQGRPQHEPIHQIGRTYFYRDMAPGAVGICLSHLSVLKDAYDAGYETIWIMEDDIEMIQNPHLLSDLIDRLDALVGREGWDILFTDRDTKAKDGSYVPCMTCASRINYTPEKPNRFSERKEISPDFRQVGARYGSYSMIVRRSGMKHLLDFFKQYNLFLPYDMEYTLPSDIKLFTVQQDIVSTQPQAPTDNGAPNYKIGLKPG